MKYDFAALYIDPKTKKYIAVLNHMILRDLGSKGWNTQTSQVFCEMHFNQEKYDEKKDIIEDKVKHISDFIVNI